MPLRRKKQRNQENPNAKITPGAIEMARPPPPRLPIEVPDAEYDFVATMGCGDACPFVRAKQRADLQIPDPKNLDWMNSTRYVT